MKYLIAIVALIAIALCHDHYTAENIDNFKSAFKACEETTHVGPQHISDFRKKHFQDDNQHLKDFMFCFMKKMHFMNDDGHLNMDHVKKAMSKDTVGLETMEHCKDKHGSTVSETAHAIYKCFVEHVPTDYKYPLYS